MGRRKHCSVSFFRFSILHVLCSLVFASFHFCSSSLHVSPHSSIHRFSSFYVVFDLLSPCHVSHFVLLLFLLCCFIAMPLLSLRRASLLSVASPNICLSRSRCSSPAILLLGLCRLKTQQYATFSFRRTGLLFRRTKLVGEADASLDTQLLGTRRTVRFVVHLVGLRKGEKRHRYRGLRGASVRSMAPFFFS